MKITLTIKQEFDAKFLRASCGVRYWEDAKVDGVSDEAGDLVPCRDGDCWAPLIDLKAGVIVNWTQGKTADIHFEVCDAGAYSLLDTEKNLIKTIDGYVPTIMCPEGNGYGDYVIMKVDADGRIANWRPTLEEFKADK